MDDGTPIAELIFELEMSLCENFPSITPFTIRRERAVTVYAMIVRYNKYAKRKKKKEGKKNIIRKPAGDTWF